MLPACRPNFANFAPNTQKVQAWFKLRIDLPKSDEDAS